MNWILLFDIIYVLILILVCLRIVYDTNSVTKTLAYLMLAIFIPLFGMLFYFVVGINYRKRKVYNKKLTRDNELRRTLEERIINRTEDNLKLAAEHVREGAGLVSLLLKDSWSPLTAGNTVKIFLNGEEKFPEMLEAMRQAKHHIHIQYYIFENDHIGHMIKDVLIEKLKEGVQVRFTYDDFGSWIIRKTLVEEIRKAGGEVFPFNKIRWVLFANRLNYRNHRKIVIIDGQTAFTGGINVSDRYINTPESENCYYWRDTHMRIDGPGCYYLQYVFLCDWNFCSGQQIQPERVYFNAPRESNSDVAVQIAASGPDSPTATIMLSLLKAIGLAKKQVLITTPYFIPGESILDALKVAALSNVSVKLLVPYKSDSRLVNAAARSYYTDLLSAGVEIYLYKKGFVHAKTLVVDDYISMVGTSNMDNRSFDLNFEVNAIVYHQEVAFRLTEIFTADLLVSEKIDPIRWRDRSVFRQLLGRIARLLSPLL